jgi:hypothetical protein
MLDSSIDRMRALVGGVVSHLDLATGVALRREPMSISAIDSRPMVTCSPVAHDRIQLARIWIGLNFLGQCNQLVGFAAHCGNDHHD